MLYGRSSVVRRRVGFSAHYRRVCIQTDTNRIIQKAEEAIFKILAKRAGHVPIVVVGTKKDKFLDEHEAKAWKSLKAQGKEMGIIEEDSRRTAEQQLCNQQKDIKQQLEDMED